MITDRFPTHYNTHCVRFNSKVWYPGSEAVNAMQQCYSNNVNWLVPPPALASAVVNKLIKDKASGTLIVPEWKSAPFWLLIASSSGFRYFIHDFQYLPENRVISKGHGKNGIFGEWPLKFKLVAFRIKF